MPRQGTGSSKVLLIEDDPGDQELIRRFLNEARDTLSVSVAADGVEAMSLLGLDNREEEPDLEQILPDLILLDLKLPKMDGFEVLNSIRTDEKFTTIPVVVLTTISDYTTLQRVYRLGANSCIVKPDRIEKIEHMANVCVEYWLNLVERPEKPS